MDIEALSQDLLHCAEQAHNCDEDFDAFKALLSQTHSLVSDHNLLSEAVASNQASLKQMATALVLATCSSWEQSSPRSRDSRAAVLQVFRCWAMHPNLDVVQIAVDAVSEGVNNAIASPVALLNHARLGHTLLKSATTQRDSLEPLSEAAVDSLLVATIVAYERMSALRFSNPGKRKPARIAMSVSTLFSSTAKLGLANQMLRLCVSKGAVQYFRAASQLASIVAADAPDALDELATCFVKTLLTGRAALPDGFIEAFLPVVRTLDAPRLTTEGPAVLAAADKALKLNSETKLEIVAQIVSNVSCDLSDFARESGIAKSAIKNLSNAKPHVSASASNLLWAIISKCTDEATVVDLLGQLLQVLVGKGPGGLQAVAQTSQRSAVAQAVNRCLAIFEPVRLEKQSPYNLPAVVANAPKFAGDSVAKLVDDIVETFVGLIAKERQDDTRAIFLDTCVRSLLLVKASEVQHKLDAGCAFLKYLEKTLSTFNKPAAKTIGVDVVDAARTVDMICRGADSDARQQRREAIAKWLLASSPATADASMSAKGTIPVLVRLVLSASSGTTQVTMESCQASLSALSVLLACSASAVTVASEIVAVACAVDETVLSSFLDAKKASGMVAWLRPRVVAIPAQDKCPTLADSWFQLFMVGQTDQAALNLAILNLASLYTCEHAERVLSKSSSPVWKESKLPVVFQLVALVLLAPVSAVRVDAANVVSTWKANSPAGPSSLEMVSFALLHAILAFEVIASTKVEAVIFGDSHSRVDLHSPTDVMRGLIPSHPVTQHAVRTLACSVDLGSAQYATCLLPLMLCSFHPLVVNASGKYFELLRDAGAYQLVKGSRVFYAEWHSTKATAQYHAFWNNVAAEIASNKTKASHVAVKTLTGSAGVQDVLQGLVLNSDSGLLFSPSVANRCCAQQSVAALLAGGSPAEGVLGSGGKLLGSSLNDLIVSVLSCDDHLEFTEHDLNVWQTVEGILYDDGSSNGDGENKKTAPAGPAKSKPAAKPKGKGGKAKSSSKKAAVGMDDWELQMRAELDSKKKMAAKTSNKSSSKSGKVSEKEKAQQQLLKAQARTRATVDAAYLKVSTVLQTVQAVLRVAHTKRDSHTFQELINLSGPVLALTSSPVFQVEAKQTLLSITEYDTLFRVAPVVTGAWDLAQILNLCHRLGKQASTASKGAFLCKYENLLAAGISVLFSLVGGTRPGYDPLDANSSKEMSPFLLNLVFPCLEVVLSGATSEQFKQTIQARLEADDSESDADQDRFGGPVDKAFGLLAGNMTMIGALRSFKSHAIRASSIKLLLSLLADEQQGGAGGGNLEWARPNTSDVMLSMFDTPEPTILLDDELELFVGDLGLLCRYPTVRVAALSCLLTYATHSKLDVTDKVSFVLRIWYASVDDTEAVVDLADDLLDCTEVDFPKEFLAPLRELLGHEFPHVRAQASRTLTVAVEEHPSMTDVVLDCLVQLYAEELAAERQLEESLKSKNSLFFEEDVDRLKAQENARDRYWRSRSGVAVSLGACADMDRSDSEQPAARVWENRHARKMFEFVLDHGLSDSHPLVREQMLEAGLKIVQVFGGLMIGELLGVVNKYLDGGGNAGQAGDWQREGGVVCLGGLAGHLDKEDPKIPGIVDTLLDALRTPSEPVQLAVTKCLPPLTKNAQMKGNAAELLDRMLNRAFDASEDVGYGERRGASMGVAGLVKGFGISSLKQHKVVAKLEEAAKSKSWATRTGALMTFELLCGTLGMLFEPYVIVILPLLLQSFSDGKIEVRECAHEAAKVVMGKLSAHGVKLILPTLLTAIQDQAWRTKQAAIQLLGSMAYCAPKQLASCLPQIVPKLVEAFSDTHAKVRVAGKEALADVGSVIQNPEILTLVPTLMGALHDPHKKTHHAVDLLHKTRFVHMVDAPSLALMVPILQRGLKERSTDTKKKSALIVGNMCSMIADPKAVQPYVDTLIPILKQVLVDPIPGVRSTAAKAFGTLTKGLGEKLPKFAELLQWLIDTMRGNTSSVERSGGAQGLVEVLVALGKDKSNEILDEHVFALATHPHGHVREGVVWVLVFLPAVLKKDGNASYIDKELTVILKGLADETEPVRDVAMRAGQVLVNQHAVSHTTELLPALEGGLESASWRIRQSSLHLLGDLLFKVGGAHAAGVVVANTSVLAEEEDIDSSDDELEDDEHDSGVDLSALSDVELAIVNALGMESRNRVLSMLYMMRCDTSGVVRQSALQVWKSIVPNTPRTMRKIMPVLMKIIIAGLSGDSYDRQTVAGRTLGDIVHKIGDRVLPEIVPIIQSSLDIQDESEENPAGSNAMERVGVSLGLKEVMSSASKKQIEGYLEILIPSVMQAICDPSDKVRKHAATSYNLLHRASGERVVNEVIPKLLAQIGSDNRDVLGRAKAVRGLKEIVSLRGKDVLPFLLPKLLSTPMKAENATALGAVAEVTGDTLHLHIERIYTVLVADIAATLDVDSPDEAETSRREAVLACATRVVASVTESGIQTAISSLLQYLTHQDPHYRKVGADLVAAFCKSSSTDYSYQVPMILKDLLKRFSEANESVLQAAWGALNALCTAVPAAEMATHLNFCRDVIQNTASDSKYQKGAGFYDETGAFALRGFCLPRGIGPLLPAYQHALMHGTTDERKSAAEGLEELITLTSSKQLKPFVVKITGPLIRIVGDRFSWEVKAAILSTLQALLEKGGPFLRPFLPQLQTTFVKALNSEESHVRNKSGMALSKLVQYSTRVDPLVTELCNGSTSVDSAPGVQHSMLDALVTVLTTCGGKVSAAVKGKLMEQIPGALEAENPKVRHSAAKVLTLVISLSDDKASQVGAFVVEPLASIGDGSYSVARRHSLACLLAQTLDVLPEEVVAEDNGKQVTSWTKWFLMDDARAVREACAEVICNAIRCAHDKSQFQVSASLTNELYDNLGVLLQDQFDEVRNIAAQQVEVLATKCPEESYGQFKVHHGFASALVQCGAKDKSSVVRASTAEALYVLLEVPNKEANKVKLFSIKPPNGDKELGKMVSDLGRKTLNSLH